jgi:hypothetical protein
MSLKSEQNNCPNCGCEVSGRNYCPDCGQANLPLRPSLKEILKEFTDDYFSLDSRLFKTLFALVFKPGVLSKEYNLGKKASYLPPLRTYLLISVLYFILPTNDIETNIIVKDVAINEATQTVPIELGTGDSLVIDFQQFKTDKSYEDSIGNLLWLDSKEVMVYSLIGEKITKRFVVNALLLGSSKEKQISFWSSLWSSISSVMFILMPAFAVLLLLLFRQGDLNYVNMLVFSIHLHSFVFLILGLKHGIMMTTGIALPPVHLLIIAVYGILALKKVFDYGYWKTTFKTLLLSVLYLMFLTVGLVGASLYAVYIS